MATHHPQQAETPLHLDGTADPVTTRSSVVNSLGVPSSSHKGGEIREPPYSSAILNPSYDPYGGSGTPLFQGMTPSVYQDSPNDEKEVPVESRYSEKESKRPKRPWFWVLVGLLALTIVLVAVIVPVYYKVINPKNNTAQSSVSATPQPTQSEAPQLTITGGDGSQVTTESGSTFVYNNSFGGFWYYDHKDPFSNKARAQSWSPPLNQSWKFGTDQIRGVNLGGWLVLEPFISPALYEPYMNASIPAIDEWTLCQNLANDSSSGGVAKVIEEHYKTFVVGLSWVRIPMPYWAIEVYPGEPFLEGVAWKYFLKAIEWARKYGLRIKLDLHTVPGSQNAYNHSGMMGRVGWLNGTMGIANAQRSLNYIRIFTQFISQPQYKDVVPIFGIINETPMYIFPRDSLERFYLEAHNMVRNITGIGEGNGPWISVYDGFGSLAHWADFMPGSDRVMVDSHSYYSFENQDISSPTTQTRKPCNSRARLFNESMATFGMTISGEFSNAFNDCGFFLNGVNLGARYDGTFRFYNGSNAGAGSCVKWMDQRLWSAAEKEAIKQFALSSFDAYQV
ncbi:unnamed protein product [Rhizoctonia solani]|nr:unnamed protein product [Rhizoctonia solani]